jgi:hypothetical protein
MDTSFQDLSIPSFRVSTKPGQVQTDVGGNYGTTGTSQGSYGTTDTGAFGTTDTTAGYGTTDTGSGTGTFGSTGTTDAGAFGGSDMTIVSETVDTIGTSGTFGGSTGYFKVDQGGILGIGAKHLYIPFSAVTNVVAGDNLTVNCSKDEADSLFGNKPDFLNDDSNS